MFLLSRSFFLPLSFSLSLCFSFFFRLTISIFIYLSLFLSLSVFPPLFVCLSVFSDIAKERSSLFSLFSLSIFLCFARRRNRWWNDEESLAITDSKTMFIPLLDPLSFEKFRLLKHTPVRRCVVTERCVPFYLRNSTVLLLSEVHVVKENFISSPF